MKRALPPPPPDYATAPENVLKIAPTKVKINDFVVITKKSPGSVPVISWPVISVPVILSCGDLRRFVSSIRERERDRVPFSSQVRGDKGWGLE